MVATFGKRLFSIVFSLALVVSMVPAMAVQQAQGKTRDEQSFTVSGTNGVSRITCIDAGYEVDSNGNRGVGLLISTNWSQFLKDSAYSASESEIGNLQVVIWKYNGSNPNPATSSTRCDKSFSFKTVDELEIPAVDSANGLVQGQRYMLRITLTRKSNASISYTNKDIDFTIPTMDGVAESIDELGSDSYLAPVLENIDGDNAGVAVHKVDDGLNSYRGAIRVDSDGNCRRVGWDNPSFFRLSSTSSTYAFADEFGYDGLMYNRDYTYFSVLMSRVKGSSAPKVFGSSQTLDEYFETVEGTGKCVTLADIGSKQTDIHLSKGTKIHTASPFPTLSGKIGYTAVDYNKVQLSFELNADNLMSDSKGRWYNGIFVSVNGGSELWYDGWRSNKQNYNLTVPYYKTSTVKLRLGYVTKKANGKNEKPEYKNLGTVTVKPQMLKKGSVAVTKLSKNSVSIKASKNEADNYTNVYKTLQVKQGKKWKNIKSKFGNKELTTFYTYKAKGAAKKQYRVVNYLKAGGKWYAGPASSAAKAKKNEWTSSIGIDTRRGRYATASWYANKISYSKGKLVVKGIVGNSRILTLKKVKITVQIKCGGKKIAKQTFTVKNIKGYATKKVTFKFKKAKKNRDLRNGGVSYDKAISPTW